MYKILLIGESCKDIFKYGNCTRLNPEAPSPIFKPTKEVINNGMAGNVKNNIHSISDAHIDIISNKEIIEKIRFVDEHSNYILLRVDNEPKLKELTIYNIENSYLSESLDSYDLVIISDYNKGFISDNVLEYIINNSKLSFIDTKRVISDWCKNVTYIKINKSESENPQHRELLLTEKYYNKTIITLGKDGCMLGDTIIKGNSVDVVDVVGAGDTFLASLACKYLESGDILKSMEFANKCSAYVVSKKGVTTPTYESITN